MSHPQPVYIPRDSADWQYKDEPGRARYRYRLLIDASGGPTAGLIHGIAEFPADGGFEAAHRHNLPQTSPVLSGSGRAWIGQREFRARAGDTFFIPAGTMHGWQAGDEALVLFWSYPADRFDQITYDFQDT